MKNSVYVRSVTESGQNIIGLNIIGFNFKDRRYAILLRHVVNKKLIPSGSKI